MAVANSIEFVHYWGRLHYKHIKCKVGEKATKKMMIPEKKLQDLVLARQINM